MPRKASVTRDTLPTEKMFPQTMQFTPVFQSDGIVINAIDPLVFNEAGKPELFRPTHYVTARIPNTPYSRDFYFRVEKPTKDTLTQDAKRGYTYSERHHDELVYGQIKKYLTALEPTLFPEELVKEEPKRFNMDFLHPRMFATPRQPGIPSVFSVNVINWDEPQIGINIDHDGELDIHVMGQTPFYCARERDSAPDATVTAGNATWRLFYRQTRIHQPCRHKELLGTALDCGEYLKSVDGTKAITAVIRDYKEFSNGYITVDLTSATFTWV